VEQGTLVTFWFAMALYAAATVLYVYYFADKRSRLAWYARFATGAGFVMQTASIAMRWIQKGSFPFEGPFESLSLTAWALILIYFVVEHLVKIKVLGALLVPAALVALIIAQLNFSTPVGEVGEVLGHWRVGIHVALVNLANAGFVIGAAASILYLVQEAQLKRHRTNVFFRRLPSLASTDRLARRAIAYSFPAYTAGILLGTLRAIEFDVAQWWGDPRVVLAGIVWVIFGAYLVFRHRQSGSSARVAAFVTIFGLFAVIALAIVARTVEDGFHIFGA